MIKINGKWKHTQETKNKISKTKKQRFRNKEVIPTMKGRKHSIETKEKMRKIKKELYKNGWVSPLKGIRKTKEHKNKISKMAKVRLKDKTKHPMYGKTHSSQSIKKMSKSHKKSYKNGKIHGMLNKTHSLKTREIISKKIKQYAKEHKDEYIQKGINSILKQSKSKVSKAELILKKYLESKNINFIHQYPYKLGVADFYLPDERLIIECYGEYWHSKPDYIERDKRKNDWLQENNYKVVILNSEDIIYKNNLNEVIDLKLLK